MKPIENKPYVPVPAEAFKDYLMQCLMPVSEELKTVANKTVIEDKGNQVTQNCFYPVSIQRVTFISFGNVNYRVMNILAFRLFSTTSLFTDLFLLFHILRRERQIRSGKLGTHPILFGINIANSKIDKLVKSRHARESGYPESIQLFEKTGFPFPRE
jgi:hypothetical protein